MPNIALSTTPLKNEDFLEVLNLFNKLNWKDLDINLSPFLLESEKTDLYVSRLRELDFNVRYASGGWCDFFHEHNEWEKTLEAVERQISIIRLIGVSSLRLFFGRLKREFFDERALKNIVKNIRSVALNHPDIRFSFENHDGASLFPEIVFQIITNVNLPNVGLTLDPVNYVKGGSDPFEAISMHRDYIFHVHVKGFTADKKYCEYGQGSFDYGKALHQLRKVDYKGNFTVEYEGEFNPIVKLNTSYCRFKEDLRKFEF